MRSTEPKEATDSLVGDLREPAQIIDMRTAEEKPSDRLRGKVNVLYYLGYHQSASIPGNDSYAAFAVCRFVKAEHDSSTAFADGGRLIHRFRGPPSPAGEGKSI